MMQLGEQESVLEASMPLPPPLTTTNGGEEKGREGSGSGELDEDGGDKIGSGGGSRWPRQETLALLKIRSDMDAVFRDSSLKGPLWEEVSRKLAGLGYHRSAKKCKEKFENVYKYHKRTKESRNAKPEGKTYRFFDQLQALEKQFSLSYPPQPQPQLQPQPQPPTPQPSLPTRPSDGTTVFHVTTTVPSTNLPPTIISPPQPSTNAVTPTTITSPTVVANPKSTSQATIATTTTTPTTNNNNVPYSLPNMNLFSSSNSTSSSTASDEDLEEKYRKKRKWKDYFRRLTRQVLSKQEEMQKRFLEAIDKREREQIAQQEAWRAQEMARINREHELLVQERSTAAAKNAAVIAFLQKLSGQQSPTAQLGANFLQQTPEPQSQPQQSQQLQQLHMQLQPQQQQPQPLVSPPPVSQPQPPQQPHQQQLVPHPLASNNNMEIQSMNNGHSNGTPLSSSRWPKAEVHALIKIRTSLEAKYQENGPKAPLWEEISAAMQRIGYNRNAKRCKEKWENINKYFKKVKESNKQRREDSKTCPYFHELEALYKEKSKTQNLFGASIHNMRTNEMMEPLMVQPEQQWRPPPQYEESVKKNDETKEREQEEEEEDYDEEEGEGDSMEEDGEGNRYEIVTNKLSSVDTVE